MLKSNSSVLGCLFLRKDFARGPKLFGSSVDAWPMDATEFCGQEKHVLCVPVSGVDNLDIIFTRSCYFFF